MPNILLIVEGRKTEPTFFKQLHIVYGINYNIYCLSTNIFTLYSRVKDFDYNCDIKNILKELHPEQIDILNYKFAYTYLIFDCDVHHPKKNDKRDIKEIVATNFDKIEKLLNYFNDETDPSKGKLYINYPMMESFKDADDFFDEQFENTIVSIENMGRYKNMVSKKKLSNRRIDSFTKEELNQLTLMNIFKLNKIINNCWGKLSYIDYRLIMESLKLYLSERKLFETKNELSVINTTLFLVLDFFGNQNGFYDTILDIK